MSYLLYKLSIPGFKKSFTNLEDLKVELNKFICNGCLRSGKEVNSMLATPCGCEFAIEDPIKNPETYLEALERFLSEDYRACIHKVN